MSGSDNCSKCFTRYLDIHSGVSPFIARLQLTDWTLKGEMRRVVQVKMGRFNGFQHVRLYKQDRRTQEHPDLERLAGKWTTRSLDGPMLCGDEFV